MSPGEIIRSERIKKGWTQEDLAERIHSTSKTIQRIESGKVKPRSSTLLALAQVLDFPLDRLKPEEQVDRQEEKYPVVPRILLHLSALLLLILPTYLLWIWVKPQFPGLKKEVLQVVNFQINVLAVMIPCGFLAFLLFPVMILAVMGLFTWVMVGINVVRILLDENPKYPVGVEVFKDRSES
jgi:transcriptional regulator with XRE-family HTH domain